VVGRIVVSGIIEIPQAMRAKMPAESTIPKSVVNLKSNKTKLQIAIIY
jgi:hypothetical protein